MNTSFDESGYDIVFSVWCQLIWKEIGVVIVIVVLSMPGMLGNGVSQPVYCLERSLLLLLV